MNKTKSKLIHLAAEMATCKNMPKVTEEMVDALVAFSNKAGYLHHPDVPYHGTVNGDSEEQWRRRLARASLEHVLTVDASLAECGSNPQPLPGKPNG